MMNNVNFLLNMTIITTVTCIGILLVKVIFRNRMSAFLHYYIWILLLARIALLPIIPESFENIFSFTQKHENVTKQSQMVDESFKDLPASDQSTKINTTIEFPKIQNQVGNIIRIYIMDIWYTGIALLLFYYCFAFIYFTNKVSKIPVCKEEKILEILKECKQKLKIEKHITLKIYDGPAMIKGFFSPVILLNDKYDNNEIKQILIHELCHLKHNDIPINFFTFIILCINWYNPIAWISFFTFKRDTEILCDYKVISFIKKKREYAILLMKSAMNHNKLIPTTIPIQNGKKEIKRRIQFMANFKKTTITYKGIMSLTVVAILFGSLMIPRVNALAENINETAAQSSSESQEQYVDEYETAVNNFANSISYDKDTKTMKFTVPETIPDGYKWYVHIAGHETIDGVGPGVFHAFEDESYNYKWENGKTYSYQFNENPLISCTFMVGLIKENSHDIKDALNVTVDSEGKVVKVKKEIKEAVTKLLATMAYDKDKKAISFTIPQTTPDNDKWFIHVSGHETTQDGQYGVFNAFEDESYNHKWENGKTYTYDFNENSLVSCNIKAGIIEGNSKDVQYPIDININSDGEINYKFDGQVYAFKISTSTN
ncbi:M56 family metallopeptidase [Clostridium saccharobutylicum]|uniref:M56 family metallopeptidase n=2 Tax=Clostridium saccharobutylicum TaxID=169679 RepID=UPI0009846900|nr:M56 family metallopeptidase [Clostridium saccharobutylicum]